MPHRLFASPLLHQRAPQVFVNLGNFRLESQGLLKMANRFVEPLLLEQDPA
jgi:hypothetical protein